MTNGRREFIKTLGLSGLAWAGAGASPSHASAMKDQASQDLAQANALNRKLPVETFHACSIYDLNPQEDAAQLVVCCEVLVFVPSINMSAVRPASPALSTNSFKLPALKPMVTFTIGRLCLSTIISTMPLSSTFLFTSRA